MFHISASLLVPRMGPGKENKEGARRERGREREGGENWTNKLKPGTALEKEEGRGREQLKHIYTPANSWSPFSSALGPE